MAGLRLVATLATITAGLGVLEWLSISSLYGSERFGGPIMGVAFVAALAVLPALLTKFNGDWYGAVVAALTAVVELLFCVAALGSFWTMAAVWFPLSLTERFMQGDSASDIIIFLMLSLGLLVAARGWSKYSTQALLASRAQLEAVRARGEIAERDQALVRAQLASLRAQTEPHFLWNTLAHLQFLTRKRPEDAERMTGHLIRYLRSAVPETAGHMTTLGTELDSVIAYLELMKIRMGSRLSISLEFDECLRSQPFPPLMLQTLAENAIKHGIEPKLGQANLQVKAFLVTKDSPRIAVEVHDDGIGLQESPATKGSGLGLTSIRERLRLVYGEAATLSISGSPFGGVISRIEIPIKAENQ